MATKKKPVPLALVREKKTPVTFRFEPTLLKRLRKHADARSTTMTAVLEELITTLPGK